MNPAFFASEFKIRPALGDIPSHQSVRPPTPWLLIALLPAVVLAAYLPALQGDFIWNDSDYVTAPKLQPLSGLSAIWTQPGATEQYYPLLHSFFWLQHLLWGDHPFGYHLVTILLHAGGAILFGLTLRKLSVPGASLAALIFALHPVHVESVAWITEQKNTLSLVFYLLSAWLYLEFDESRRPRAYVFAFTCFVLSMLCKTVTASLPAALLVVIWYRRKRLDWRRDFRPLAPWLVAGVTVGLFTSWVEQHYLGAKGENFNLPFIERGLVAGRAIWFYLGKLVWPFDLNFLYHRWTPDRSVWWQWLFPLGVLVLLGVLWALRRHSRAPLAAFLLFIGSLFPVLGFVNLYGALYSFVWDHWQYLPDLSLIALGAAALSLLWNRVESRFRGMGPALVAALALFLGALTWAHCGMFHDNVTLYRETLRRNPDAWMAHFNLGVILTDLPGKVPEAIQEYEATLLLKPDHWKAQTNLGNALLKLPNRMSDAIAHYEAALRIKPDLAEPHYSLGNLCMLIPGRSAEGIAHYEAAIRINPRFAAAHYNLGNALAETPSRMPDAIVHYRAALQIDPDMAEAHFNLGIALLNDHQPLPEAIAQLEAARRIKPDLPPTLEIIARWRLAQ